MKTKFRLATLALFSAVVIPHTALGQGALTPPGAPAPTMKTLAQIEPRTPISSVPFTISEAGSYYLTANVTTSVSNAITIAASGVTLDLNGFTIFSAVDNAAEGGTAILLSGGLNDITIANGHIRGGVTNNGFGFYSGSGFGYGISCPAYPPAANVLVSRVSISGCLYHGIFFYTGNSTVVENCTVRTVGGIGIFADTIKASSAVDCASHGIYGGQVSDCNGQSTGSGSGVTAANTALNCYGYSVSSTGVSAEAALNCFGVSSTGTGINANTAQNCSGFSGTGTGCWGYEIAIGCTGRSTLGVGLRANVANSSTGYGPTGYVVNFKYNMP